LRVVETHPGFRISLAGVVAGDAEPHDKVRIATGARDDAIEIKSSQESAVEPEEDHPVRECRGSAHPDVRVQACGPWVDGLLCIQPDSSTTPILYSA
jgi:hypothetical protein